MPALVVRERAAQHTRRMIGGADTGNHADAADRGERNRPLIKDPRARLPDKEGGANPVRVRRKLGKKAAPQSLQE
jgi:hypothetical protein